MVHLFPSSFPKCVYIYVFICVLQDLVPAAYVLDPSYEAVIRKHYKVFIPCWIALRTTHFPGMWTFAVVL